MPARKQFQSALSVSPELRHLLEKARRTQVSEEDLRKQRVSFAFGNAPESEWITRASVRYASEHIRLKRKK
jgi:hypothetical protein